VLASSSLIYCLGGRVVLTFVCSPVIRIFSGHNSNHKNQSVRRFVYFLSDFFSGTALRERIIRIRKEIEADRRDVSPSTTIQHYKASDMNIIKRLITIAHNYLISGLMVILYCLNGCITVLLCYYKSSNGDLMFCKLF